MNKKVGILTLQYPENKNFGAILQTYAVSTMIKNEGLNAELINLFPKKEPKFLSKIAFKVLANDFQNFSEKYLKTTERCNNIESLKKMNNKFNTFLVGSDQVWRPLWLKGYLPHYYFDFVEEGKKKIAYAASFGVDFWEGNESQTKQMKELAQRFDCVSTREESGVDICKEQFDVEATCVLDPTMMINRVDYQPILNDYKCEKHKESKYIAHMLLDDSDELTKGSNEIANYLSAEIIKIKGKYINIFGKNLFKYNKVSQWLKYLEDAELVVTDSFHCAVFSILFKKRFVVVANPTRGIARLRNLLTKLKLEDRFFTNINEVIESGILDQKVDYKVVHKELDKYREKSFEFLRNALRKKKENESA